MINIGICGLGTVGQSTLEHIVKFKNEIGKSKGVITLLNFLNNKFICHFLEDGRIKVSIMNILKQVQDLSKKLSGKIYHEYDILF